MADPISLGLGAGALSGGGAATGIGVAGTGLSILGGITGAVGKIFGGQSNAKMYEYQAGVAQLNKQISLQNADYARHVGEVEAQRVGMKGRFEQGQATVAQSGRGLAINSGSALATRDSMGDMTAHDMATVRSNAARRAYGFDIEATKQSTQAQMYGAAASGARTGSYIDAAGSLLGTAGSVATKWLDASRVGLGSGRGISFENPGAPYAQWDPNQSWEGA